MKNKPTHNDPGEEDEQLLRDVNDAMKSLGWRIPLTAEDVRGAEEALAEVPVRGPAGLIEPAGKLDGGPVELSVRPQAFADRCDGDIETTLARAAREAGHLTPEIEEAMRQDRQDAERRRNHGKGDT